MQVKAAIAWEAGKPLEIETIDLEGPRAGECLVRLAATGVCHTDAYTLSGRDPEGLFPVVLGHEGAGVVEEVGPGVRGLAPGDHVIPLYIPECRECRYCLSGRTNLCVKLRATQGRGLMPDGSSRLSHRGRMLHHYMGTSTFAERTVLPEIALAKIRPDAPLDKVCLLGCAVTTGIGAVLHTAKVEPGASVAVFGLGGVGLSVIQGAVMAGAERIIGVDLNPKKFELAARFGATEFVNPAGVKDLAQAIVDRDRRRRRLLLRMRRQRRADGAGARLHAARLGAGDHHRRRRGGGADPRAPVPAGDRAVVARLGLRRDEGPHAAPGVRRSLPGWPYQARRAGEPYASARVHQRGLRPDAPGRGDPQRDPVPMNSAHLRLAARGLRPLAARIQPA